MAYLWKDQRCKGGGGAGSGGCMFGQDGGAVGNAGAVVRIQSVVGRLNAK